MRNDVVCLMVALATLTGCASPGDPVKMLPPVDLIAATQQPRGDVSTNGGLVLYTQALKNALAACNRDKASLSLWAGEAGQ